MNRNGIQTLSQRRKDICMSYFKKLRPEHKLHDLVPDRCENLVNYTLRNVNHISLIDCKTNRFRN